VLKEEYLVTASRNSGRSLAEERQIDKGEAVRIQVAVARMLAHAGSVLKYGMIPVRIMPECYTGEHLRGFREPFGSAHCLRIFSLSSAVVTPIPLHACLRGSAPHTHDRPRSSLSIQVNRNLNHTRLLARWPYSQADDRSPA
jgi:hypothetical protein